MLLGGISIKVIKLMMAILALGLFLVASGSARDAYSSSPVASTYDSSMYGHHDDHNWNHNDHDWLSPGGSHFGYPTTYYYDWYYTTPTYAYTYPTYYYPTYYYTTPVYPPVVYHNWDLDPWWGANAYGFGGNYYYTSSSHWTYSSGYGFGYP